ncbi:single-stranded DNA-binding protein [Microvirga sp. BT688]|uniref:single-stranded DNA-binding protein n=1 Tax=Microvirga sp. TaxID=1873136 RepID=UPI0016895F93|nr:single-stranded DNA-binding protein [Microvirga sp.]MBD2745737.1 single-stranded DNA-binding protein [Microvirga sp.]
MKNINEAEILGNVGRDPEIRTMGNGEKVANLRVATNETWKANGETKTKTEWHSVVIYNANLIDIVEKHVKKGSPILLKGLKIQYRSFKDKDQIERQVTDLVLNRFNGEMILLPSGNGGDAGADHGGSTDGLGGQDDDDPFRD